jgi:acyl-CoA thioesterase-1
MKLIISLWIVLALTSCGEKEVITSNQKSDPIAAATFRILALGDSLTEGLGVLEASAYPAQLQNRLHELGFQHIEVINAGLSGETTSGLKNRLAWVMKQKPDLTILCIGANDAMRGLPLDLTINNLDEIITTIKNNDSDLILAGMQIYDNLGKEYVSGFKDIYPQMAIKYSIPLIPFLLEDVAGSSELNQADMLHPNAKGYEVIVEKNVIPRVLAYLENKQPRENDARK